MTNSSLRLLPLVASLLAAVLFTPCALAQEEIAPSQGKGHVVVLVSGIMGPKHDKALSEAIAALGYDVYVCDGRQIAKTLGGNLRAAILAAQRSPHALPGKVALVGISLGGGFSLALGSEWPDLVAVDIVWYPATGFAARQPGFVRRMSVPVLMFAGESDHFENCCLIETARAIESSAKANNAPFELDYLSRSRPRFHQGRKKLQSRRVRRCAQSHCGQIESSLRRPRQHVSWRRAEFRQLAPSQLHKPSFRPCIPCRCGLPVEIECNLQILGNASSVFIEPAKIKHGRWIANVNRLLKPARLSQMPAAT